MQEPHCAWFFTGVTPLPPTPEDKIYETYFSKNMVVNLLVAVLGTNILLMNGNYQEGMKQKEETLSLVPPTDPTELQNEPT